MRDTGTACRSLLVCWDQQASTGCLIHSAWNLGALLFLPPAWGGELGGLDMVSGGVCNIRLPTYDCRGVQGSPGDIVLCTTTASFCYSVDVNCGGAAAG
eukprot:2515983-Amphidinium_carterae.2